MSSQLGQKDCVDNVTLLMSDAIIPLPPGTVCIECSGGGEVANDTVNDSNITASIGRVIDGVLMVNDSESVFITVTDVQCSNSSALISIFINGKS